MGSSNQRPLTDHLRGSGPWVSAGEMEGCPWPCLPGSLAHQTSLCPLATSQGVLSAELNGKKEDYHRLEGTCLAWHLIGSSQHTPALQPGAPGLARRVQGGVGAFVAQEPRSAEILCSQRTPHASLLPPVLNGLDWGSGLGSRPREGPPAP